MGTVYILQSQNNGRYYIGSTNNINRRLKEHEIGHSTYTKLTRPFTLVFQQSYPSLEEARKIESKLKKFKSKKIIEDIIRDGVIKVNSVG